MSQLPSVCDFFDKFGEYYGRDANEAAPTTIMSLPLEVALTKNRHPLTIPRSKYERLDLKEESYFKSL